MFDWNDLRFFLEVSRRGRLVTAARHLAVDHTTVSRRIQALEERMNTKLFEGSLQRGSNGHRDFHGRIWRQRQTKIKEVATELQRN